jgi:hypothetical protein
MKKAFVAALSAFILARAAHAQGTIIFSNRNIDRADGSGIYNVPLWDNTFSRTPAGLLPGGVTVGLFYQGNLLLTAGGDPVETTLRTDANAMFFAQPSSLTAVVPGVLPGSTAFLEVRAWQGPSFTDAYGDPNHGNYGNGSQYGVWAFTSRPLGGTNGDRIYFTPTLTGWGLEDGSGLSFMVPTPEPSALSLLSAGLFLVNWSHSKRRSQ